MVAVGIVLVIAVQLHWAVAVCAIWLCLVLSSGWDLLRRKTRQRGIEKAIVAVVVLFLVVFLLPEVSGSREASRRKTCNSNLRQICLALHAYHEIYGRFPPAYVADQGGKPMHSWRVLILPFMEERELYDAYDLDEPWDGPNNRKLADQCPEVFLCPSSTEAGPANVNYVAVVGPRTMWLGSESTRRSDAKDGTANTIMLVEVVKSRVHWMEPRDPDMSQLALRINPPLQPGRWGISSRHPGGAQVAMADGSVLFLSETTDWPTVEGLLKKDDGMVSPVDWGRP
jgi:prepilin-type processing-associated H-X9-DG protein